MGIGRWRHGCLLGALVAVAAACPSAYADDSPTRSVAIRASADAELSAVAPARALGAFKVLKLSARPQRFAWLAFDVPRTGSLLSAKLRLTVLSGSLRGLVVREVVPSARHGERTLTYKRGLRAGGTAGSAAGSKLHAGVLTIPISASAIRAGRVELALVARDCSGACGRSALRLAARELGSRGPRLELTTVNPDFVTPVGPQPVTEPPAPPSSPAPPTDPPATDPTPTDPPPPPPDTTAPAVTLTQPSQGATTNSQPVFSGAAGTADGDSATVTVRVYQGTGTTGPVAATLTATRAGAAWTVQPASALPQGALTAQAEQADAASNKGLSQAVGFTVDDVAPDTQVDSGPTGLTNDATPAFGFSSADNTASFECATDAGAFSSCSSPFTTAALADGQHSFLVRARDGAGNVDASPATRTFTVDATPPPTTIDSGPTSPTNDSTPTFQFSSTDGSASFDCWVDSGTPTTCSSPHTTATLADGGHTLNVRARDTAGNVDATPATQSFTVDTTPPNVSISSGPSGATADSTPTYAFSSNESGVQFTCWVDSGTPASCPSPWTTATLSDGAHTINIGATDSAGNPDPTPATRSITVDTTPPDTSIDSGPTGLTADSTPTFGFSSPDAQASFECNVDGGNWSVCASPWKTSALADGQHTVAVRAKDTVGNPDPSPATRSFTLDTAAPAPTVTSPSSGASTDGLPTLTGAAGNAYGDDTGVTVRIWSGTGTAGSPLYTIPVTRSGAIWSAQPPALLQPADYTVQAEQSDSAGQTGTSSAVTFTVQPTVAAAGDIACDPNSANYNGGVGDSIHCRQQATSDLLVGHGYHSVFALGDNQYVDGDPAKFQQVFDPTWGRMKSVMHPVPGNHEYQWVAAGGYFDYFNGTGVATGQAGDRGKGYYSFEVGSWHVVALNSNCSNIDAGGTASGCAVGSPQEVWLRADLAAHPTSCTLVYWHHPRFTSSNVVAPSTAVDPLWRAAAELGADVVLNGHAHGYERFAPMDATGTADVNGMREIVAGTGGDDFQTFGAAAPNSVTKNASTFGVLRLMLKPGSYDWEFEPIAGSTSTFTDSGSGTCH